MANSADVADLRILIIGPLTDGSGNYSTASRIRSYFADSRNVCYTKNVSNFEGALQFRDFIYANHIQCVLAIHAFKCAALLKDCPVPYAVIFGGTDLNENCKSDAHKEIISSTATSARCLVAFSTVMSINALRFLPHCDPNRIKIIPQAVKTCPANYNWRSEYQISGDCKVFTLVAGIRPVKDPLYLVHCFSDWWLQKGHRIAYLVIIGPELQKDYFERFYKTILSLKGVAYLGQLSVPKTHCVIADSFALVNSSVSEGMSTAILEAMELRVPVIARSVSGNASIISHKCNGLLYNNPTEFIEMMELLISESGLRNALIENACNRIEEHHSCKAERRQYFKLVKELIGHDYDDDGEQTENTAGETAWVNKGQKCLSFNN